MRPLVRYHCIFWLLVLSCQFVYGQSDPSRDQKKSIRVLVIPPYDLMANSGKSPGVKDWIVEALNGKADIELIPFDKKYYQVVWQLVYDKKYLEPILAVREIDIIVMSKLDLMQRADDFDESLWSLSLRLYHVKNKTQDDIRSEYQKVDRSALKQKIGSDTDLLAMAINNYYHHGSITQESTVIPNYDQPRGYDQLTDAEKKGWFTRSEYNTDLKHGKNIERPDKGTLTNPAFDTRLLFKIWAADLDGPHADFSWQEDYFFVVDYDGDGNMPYTINKDEVTIFYNDFVKIGTIKKVTADSLIIRWQDAALDAIYFKWN